MKIYIESMNLVIVLHNLHLYNKKKISKFGYLFSTPKRYLIDLDFLKFKKFIEDCLDHIYNSDDQEEIIHLIEKYNYTTDDLFKIEIIRRIGYYILTNPKIKHFKYLQKIIKYYNNDIGTEQNMYIKFLIILINNLLSIQQINQVFSNPLNILDIVFDYYL